MNKAAKLLIVLVILALLSGCWSQFELPDRGFVMGVALDEGKNGKIEMTTQVYRPQPAHGGHDLPSSGNGTAGLNITTTDTTVMEAVRDIPIHLGRKAQWSHMRVIVIGEQLARSVNMGELLDFFYRDHEPRVTVSLMIAKGRAGEMLNKQPIIEQTMGQQLLSAKKFAASASAKTIDTTLLKWVLQSLSAHNDSYISYVYENKDNKDVFSAAGLALFKGGKLAIIMSPKKTEGLVMLRNEYDDGVIQLPCDSPSKEMETLEIINLQTKIKTHIKGDQITVHVKAQGDGAIGELKCTSIKNKEEEAVFIHKVEEAIKTKIRNTVHYLQKNKIDVIGIGNLIYRKHPKQWKNLSNGWDDTFAEIPFNVEVKLRLVTGGTVISKPVTSEP
ncbi:spore germination protein KC [Paenibacillus catalpae]|uniref:Spore germination protein KC n=1 Tax=Paenibacillus catalpae TaxID=1045775 RepID=A0A1I1VGC5_9BACL|nr:Ger(x)C family spore germination protein [Paenibacillus catalpae]SFD79540.1 spore germination protein KC [Paenibacillus catalpae]